MRQARSHLKRLLRPGTEVIVIAACARELPLLSTNLVGSQRAQQFDQSLYPYGFASI
jgi:hypothetical protein